MLIRTERAELFVINLDADRHRLDRFAATMDRFGTPFARWSATSGADLDDRKFGRRPVARGVFVTRFRSWSANEAACGVSHIRLLRDVVRRRVPWTIVMEDDAVLTRELPLEINSWELPPDADIVLLNDRALPGPVRRQVGDFVYADVAGGAGTEAYLVSLNGARKLLRVLYPFMNPLDFQMFAHFESIQRLDAAPFYWRLPRNPHALDTSLRAYRLVPGVVRHTGVDSSIGNQRHPHAHLYCKLLLGMELGRHPLRSASSGGWRGIRGAAEIRSCRLWMGSIGA